MRGNVCHLATGIAVRDGRLLMVASRYPNRAEALWNLPGGRQLHGELLSETVVREVFEETGLRVDAQEVAYVSESYDRDVHYLNVAFRVAMVGAPFDSAQGDMPFDAVYPERSRGAQGDTSSARGDKDAGVDHVVAVEWVPLEAVRERIVVAVVREPLLAYLSGELKTRYAGYHEAGVTIEWPPDSQ